MSESVVAVTQGSGKNLHTNSYNRGDGTTVEDEVVIPGPYPYATYIMSFTAGAYVANDHIACLNAGGSLKVRVHRIRITQVGSATAALVATFNILRTTTAAPTGGTAITPVAFDTADAASGAAGRSIPTVKGTESTIIFTPTLVARQAILTTASQVDGVWEWRAAATTGGTGKPVIIPAGTTNGLAIKAISASTNLTWNVEIEFTETAF